MDELKEFVSTTYALYGMLVTFVFGIIVGIELGCKK